eukprot:TRINITY_DN2542_c0_g1_i3.p1 TRINITY_DN2542_c0_g1~~TRINITY_DN2542_c0_g1_i3.p1  ORF type:complete len:468 (-),score=79.14 TRINITY_DN2542_c0_g1_i3:253-1656(-)
MKKRKSEEYLLPSPKRFCSQESKTNLFSVSNVNLFQYKYPVPDDPGEPDIDEFIESFNRPDSQLDIDGSDPAAIEQKGTIINFVNNSNNTNTFTFNNQTSNHNHQTSNPVYTVDNFWGLPMIVKEIFASKKITKFYDWQIECLSSQTLLQGGNLIYSLPTSGGKTLVAEITLLRTVILKNKKALFVLPFVSIVTEKVQSLEEFGRKLSFQVEGYYGGEGVMPPPPGNQICVATIEKANSIINNLIEEGRLSELGCVVVDEFHMISTEGRGHILELLLTKILYVSNNGVQIIGMSATIPNLEELCDWLYATPYQHNFRPVPLQEYYKVGDTLHSKDGVVVKKFAVSPQFSKTDPDQISDICLEVIPESSVLVFCSSKDSTEQTAEMLAKVFEHHPHLIKHKADEKQSILQKITATSGQHICSTLRRVIPFGIAYHHAGLTHDERNIVEQGFRDRLINVICCTSTLAAD